MKWITQMTLVATAALLTACVPEPEPTTFVLTNTGESEIFHDVTGSWLTLQVDGERARLNEPGCMRRCGSLEGPIVCATGMPYPTVKRLEPGQSSTIEWDGTYYLVDDERNCYRERRVARPFEAQFCYGYEYETFEGEEPDESGQTISGAWVDNPICEVQVFERGTTVDLEAE